jgi:hypothetical protein
VSDETQDPGFSTRQRRALESLLDEIIPRSGDGRLPGAGEAGLVDYIDRNAAGLRPAIERALSRLGELAGERGARDFAALSREDRLEVLNRVATDQPDLLPGLILHTYIGYYQSDRVLAGLGLEPRPPYPAGYEMEPGDLSLLDGVRRRSKLYRD